MPAEGMESPMVSFIPNMNLIPTKKILTESVVKFSNNLLMKAWKNGNNRKCLNFAAALKNGKSRHFGQVNPM